MNILEAYWLDILTTILGLIYIWLEYRASIALWLIGIIMPALDIILYWQHGLYGDAGMACYYTLAAVYGLIMWSLPLSPSKKRGNSDAEQPPLPLEGTGGSHYPHAPRQVSARHLVFLCGVGCYLLRTLHVDQLYRSPTRLLHQCLVVCRHVGIGAQIYRAVVLLDCC